MGKKKVGLNFLAIFTPTLKKQLMIYMLDIVWAGNFVYAGYVVGFGVTAMIGKFVYKVFKRYTRPTYPVNCDPTNDL